MKTALDIEISSNELLNEKKIVLIKTP